MMITCSAFGRRPMKVRLFGLVVCLFLLAPLLASAASSDVEEQEVQEPLGPPIYNIGIVTDGTTAIDLETMALYQREIQTLAEVYRSVSQIHGAVRKRYGAGGQACS